MREPRPSSGRRAARADIAVLLFRFVFGFLLGGIVFLFLSWIGGVPVYVSGPIPFFMGFCAMIWGDRFLETLARWIGRLPG